jgi:hypothetical protein
MLTDDAGNLYNLNMNRVVPSHRLVVAAALLLPSLLCAQDTKRGRKYTPPPPTSTITVTVTKAANGKPVENAAVVFHPINKEGKDEGGLELKTNEEGKATLDVIPIGDTLRLQIIATGYQTFGNDYPITGDTKDIAVKLRHPARQYSIYEQHQDGQVGGTTPEEQRAKPATTAPPGTSN